MKNEIIVAVFSLLVFGISTFVIGLQNSNESQRLRNQYIGFGVIIAAMSLTFSYLPAVGIFLAIVVGIVLSALFASLTTGDKSIYLVSIAAHSAFLSISLPQSIQNVLFPAAAVGFGIFSFASSNSSSLTEKEAYYKRLVGSLLLFPFTALLLLALRLAWLQYS